MPETAINAAQSATPSNLQSHAMKEVGATELFCNCNVISSPATSEVGSWLTFKSSGSEMREAMNSSPCSEQGEGRTLPSCNGIKDACDG